VSGIKKKNYQVTPAALFVTILRHKLSLHYCYYLSLVSQTLSTVHFSDTFDANTKGLLHTYIIPIFMHFSRIG